jgi:hypothetical protein
LHPAPDVNWDGYLYHVGCLLDKLAAEPRLDVDLSNWRVEVADEELNFLGMADRLTRQSFARSSD